MTLGVVLDVLPGLRGLGALQTLPELAVVLYNGVNLVIYHAYKINIITYFGKGDRRRHSCISNI